MRRVEHLRAQAHAKRVQAMRRVGHLHRHVESEGVSEAKGGAGGACRSADDACSSACSSAEVAHAVAQRRTPYAAAYAVAQRRMPYAVAQRRMRSMHALLRRGACSMQ